MVDDVAVWWCWHDNLMKANRRGFSVWFLYHRLWIAMLAVIPAEVFYFIKICDFPNFFVYFTILHPTRRRWVFVVHIVVIT